VSYHDYSSGITEAGTISEPYSGLNFTLGAWGHLKPVKLGAVVHTPLNLKYHDEYSGDFFASASARPASPPPVTGASSGPSSLEPGLLSSRPKT